MTVTVKLFAILRDAAGVGEIRLAIPDGATAADAGNAVSEKYPQIAAYLPKIAYAVNLAYVSGAEKLSDGDEVALIPAVSGG